MDKYILKVWRGLRNEITCYSQSDREMGNQNRVYKAYKLLIKNDMVLVIFMWYTRKKEVIKMEGKFNIWQKCLEIVCFVLILASSIYKGLFCDGDMGVVITLSFVAILLFIIFSIAALFPATWRMTDREKEKISDLKRYQEKYTSIFVIVNLVLSIFMAWLMLVIG